MNADNQKALFKRFPKFFKQRKLPINQTCMCWGLEIGNGWFDLMYELCEELEQLNSKGLEFTQVKEKWGMLRIYVNSATEECYDMIHEYEKKSSHICEECGKKGTNKQTFGWFSTMCTKCRNIYKKSKERK